MALAKRHGACQRCGRQGSRTITTVGLERELLVCGPCSGARERLGEKLMSRTREADAQVIKDYRKKEGLAL